MKLYRKKLHSVDELLREKHVLKYALRQSKKDGALPTLGKKNGSKVDVQEESSDILSIVGDFFTSKSAMDMGLSVGLPLLKVFGRKAEKGVFKSLAGEILGGYVKWKAIQIGFRMAKRMVKSQQRKKDHKR